MRRTHYFCGVLGIQLLRVNPHKGILAPRLALCRGLRVWVAFLTNETYETFLVIFGSLIIRS